MNKRIKARWIKALTSGRYKQAKKALSNGTSFCCLGVLCDLYRKSVSGEWDDANNFHDGAGDVRGALLPNGVTAWAALPNNDPVVGRVKSLSTLNDEGETFEYIAKRIEKYL